MGLLLRFSSQFWSTHRFASTPIFREINLKNNNVLYAKSKDMDAKFYLNRFDAFKHYRKTYSKQKTDRQTNAKLSSQNLSLIHI